jgi:acetoin utilization deacetylase AcuC-like enzyme
MTTAFFSDERCFWHGGGTYAFTLPVGGLVQPLPAGLPENPETKRRLRNLIEVTGLSRHLSMRGADPAGDADLGRVHPQGYLAAFKSLSDAGDGDVVQQAKAVREIGQAMMAGRARQGIGVAGVTLQDRAEGGTGQPG